MKETIASQEQNAGQPNRHSSEKSSEPLSASRRGFLKTAGIGAAGITAASVFPGGLVKEAEGGEIGRFSKHPNQRAADSFEIRKITAKKEADVIHQAFPHPTNGDEELYRDQAFAGNFSKTLPHDPATGLVVPDAYKALLEAFENGTLEAFEAVPAGGTDKLVGPLSALAFQLQGVDPTAARQQFVPPSVASAAGAAEMVELYWEALLRDVPFSNYGANSLVAHAVADLNKLSAFAGPKPVTPQNIFRYGKSSAFPGANAFFGADSGPYVSQILYQTHPLDGVTFIPQIQTVLPVADPDTGEVLTGTGTGRDFMTNFPEYLFVENGKGPQDRSTIADPQPRFIRNGRDLGSLVSQDFIYSIYFRAVMLLATRGVPLQASSPYANASRMYGLNTFSDAWLLSLIGAGQQAQSPAYYQKWFVQRKLRPEAFGNLVDGIMSKRFTLNPSIHSDLVNSAVLPLIFERNRQLNVKRNMGTAGSFLLPQQWAFGSPSHPDAPAGHAFAAGCSVTLLKAVLDVGTPDNPKPWPAQPVQASADGLSLVRTSDKLTLLGELNKLAFNVAEGRNWLGIHSRVGGNSLGMTLGEDTAIRLLEDMGFTYPEKFNGWTLTKFDGTTVTIGASRKI